MRRPNRFPAFGELQWLRVCCLASVCILAAAPTMLLGQGNAPASAPAVREGQHDFDFDIGTWKTHVKRLQHPLTGSDTWTEYEGTTVVSGIWNGRANLAELEADGPAGHLEVLSLRLYNPQSRQWSLNTASSRSGTISVPTIGEFKNGRGEFYDTEPMNGRNILVRNVWSDITPNSCRFEQSFSADGGKTWEVNWIADDTRITDSAEAAKVTASQSASGVPAQHDFDPAFGTWNTHLSRLVHPLTGLTTWVTYNGTATVRKVWNGRASLEEFVADGTSGHIEGVTLRLYDPQAHQWNQVWATSNDGTLGRPMIGEFRNGRGEFYDQEPVSDGRAIFVRWVQTFIPPKGCRFEQSFSKDGGRTWELNWVNVYTRAGK